MSERSIRIEALKEAALALYDEAYLEASNPKATWFTDNEPRNGFLGSIEGISAATASKPLTPGDPITLASHVGHLRFSLGLANRAMKGENPYPEANWARSWDVRQVDEAEWRALISGLRSEYEALRSAIGSDAAWKDDAMMTGTISLIAHGAWHLGAIRQALGLIKAPKA